MVREWPRPTMAQTPANEKRQPLALLVGGFAVYVARIARHGRTRLIRIALAVLFALVSVAAWSWTRPAQCPLPFPPPIKHDGRVENNQQEG
jgi:hypothetical protein